MELDKQYKGMLKEQFIIFLQTKGLSQETITTYLYYYEAFYFDLLYRYGQEFIYTYISTYNNSVSRAMLKQLMEFIKRRNDLPDKIILIAKDPDIPRITGAKKKKVLRWPTEEEVFKIAEAMPDNKLMLMTLTTFYLGLRQKELRGLTVGDIDWEKGIVHIRPEISKKKKGRSIPIPQWLLKEISAYINDMVGKTKLNKTDAKRIIIFNVKKKYWWKEVTRTSRKAGIDYHVTPHSLRHACGSFLHKQGLDLITIRDFLGHSSVSTTQIYVHADREKANKDILNAFSN